MEYARREELRACLDHLLDAAGNPNLLTAEFKTTLAEHALGNYRVLTTMAAERLADQSTLASAWRYRSQK